MLTTTETTLHITCGELATALRRVKAAQSTEETRYYLCGVYLHTHAGRLRLVACDGYRLHLADTTAEAPADMPGVILPSDYVARLLAIVGKGKVRFHDCRIVVTPSRVVAYPWGEPLECEPVDGTYPDYLRILPRKCITACSLPREAITKAITAMCGWLRPYDNPSVLLTCKADALTIAARAAAAVDNPGEATLRVALRGPAEPFEVAVDPTLLRDALAAFGPGAVELRFTDAGSAMVLAPSGPYDSGMLAVVMPRRY